MRVRCLDPAVDLERVHHVQIAAKLRDVVGDPAEMSIETGEGGEPEPQRFVEAAG